MSRVTAIALCVLSVVCTACGGGMSCNVVGGTCPGIFSLNSENTFCCPGENSEFCCDVAKYVEITGTKAVLPIVLGALSLIVIFICCVCCACCSCCPCYRKRERGIIYAAQGPSTVVQVNQTPGNNQFTQPLYPAQVMPTPPPSYTPEAYSKQSPYNPHYPNP